MRRLAVAASKSAWRAAAIMRSTISPPGGLGWASAFSSGAGSARVPAPDASGQYDAEFDAGGFTGLSNHLPMALAALKRLGADDARLAAFAARYSQRLRPAPAPAEWPAGEPWRARLGQTNAWPAYRHLFLHWLVTESADAVLQQTMPTLMAGCGGAAFHGLIRTAYAVQSGHGQELADALAYWACRWLDLGAPPPSSGTGTRADPAPLLKG